MCNKILTTSGAQLLVIFSEDHY